MASRGGKTPQQGIKAHFTRHSKTTTTNSGTSLASPASSSVAAKEANAGSMTAASLPPEMESLHRLMTASMENIIAPLKRTMDEVKIIVEDQGKRIVDLEENATQLTERVTALEAICEQLLTQNESLNERMEDASNRSRRCNLRVTNVLPSPGERNDCVQFMQNFFATVLGDVFTEPPILDRAHRIGKENPGPNPRPRVMIVRFHYFQDKMRALRADRSLLQWKGQKIMLYPDYAPATVKLRATFTKTADEAQRFYDRRIARLPDMERNTTTKPARRGRATTQERGDTGREREEENGAGLGNEEDGTHGKNGPGGEDEAMGGISVEGEYNDEVNDGEEEDGGSGSESGDNMGALDENDGTE
ncbi:uncharacterized protein LOC133656224 isoform X1 [Entelurus aequoreus]|uniref:uncharacterized protein LOC133632414 isoform X1 n=3 Tax=Entelurus aequoreus TaxID=161455 RepID=UPI002B1E3975|nr:uncharacterized protein LOC133632414 isoform X1 [Entelurus aequoreus]XP_061896077.1 uncharacterized protein LOC133645213 isoform X1 [Entelurus aequoreus]XP_061900271.1 uncharacterized protein LOC133648316 isoform X1 [Entelurus aequoreus]XP_061909236.1 uncharacterized protein LOC133653690 isoform X1 [Entelurus aequoreus]XP_061913136.1 uncharacterized protein LOC133656224 isoform X1 [Entelurus aequoreus]